MDTVSHNHVHVSIEVKHSNAAFLTYSCKHFSHDNNGCGWHPEPAIRPRLPNGYNRKRKTRRVISGRYEYLSRPESLAEALRIV